MNTCAVSLCAYYFFFDKKKSHTHFIYSFSRNRFRGYIFIIILIFEQMKAQHAVENLKSSLAQHLLECIHGTFDALFRQNVNVLGLNTRLLQIQQELWLNSFKTSDAIWLSDRNFDQKSRPLVEIPVRSEPSNLIALVKHLLKAEFT